MLLVAALGLSPVAGGAVAVDQVDDFEDGTVQNWFVGAQHPAPPENIPDGGPAGAGDNFMLLTALGGNGPGSRLAVINITQWAGDYLAAGVTDIEVDLWNPSDSDLYVRLLFADPLGAPPANAAITDPVILPAGSGWTHAAYSIDPADLIPLAGDPGLALSQATEMRIFHSVDPEYPPDPIAARLAVDNIHALGGPTPVQESSWGKVRGLYR
jgi:hypothetical protein